MARIIIDECIPFIRGKAERFGECLYLPPERIDRRAVKDADVLIVRTRTRCNEQLLAGSRVRFVATATIGIDHLDTAYLDACGIVWANCPGCNAASVAQYIECSLYLLYKDGLIPAFSDLTVGIVGVGHVGSAVAARLEQLGCRLLLCDPPLYNQGKSPGRFRRAEEALSLDELAQRADIITFHTPLTRSGLHPTFHMAGEAFFHRLAQRPFVVNTSRGEVVDTSALLNAARSGRLRGTIIDTWENEPHISRSLLDYAYLATPHIAGYSADGKANATRMTLESLARFFNVPASFTAEPPALPFPPPEGASPMERALLLYNPRRDSEALKADPERFEYFRNHYPLRREHF